MDEHDLIPEFVRELRHARTFESAAVATLSALLKIADDCLEHSDFRSDGSLLRAMAHLRPNDGYRGLVVLAHGASEVTLPDNGVDVLPSVTAWKLVETCGTAVAVDVQLGRYQAVDGNAFVDAGTHPRSSQSFDSTATVQRLLGRDTTHLYVVPMRGPGSAVLGMISLEACCHSAKGREFIWPRCAGSLQLLGDLATATLIALPLHARVPAPSDPEMPVVGESMTHLIELLRLFARQDETILISGPTGVGKSRLALWCHMQSARRDQPFQTVDLPAVPEDMQMAELFGWKRGAFTGAVASQAGCVARAEGGTLFIDEIDKLSLKAQSGLLQLLETGQYRALGDPAGTRKGNVRFLVGTNVDLRDAVAQGRFREDLYYRINVLPVRLPPLTERADEIGAWAHFMVARRHGQSDEAAAASLASAAVSILTRHPWPGNLRQLDNVLRRAYAMAMFERSSDHEELTIGVRHVEGALAYEGELSQGTVLMSSLHTAALAFAHEALSRSEHGQALGLQHTAAFRGLVLKAAHQRLKDLKEVYRRFGHDKLVDSRNHTRDYRRELDKVELLGRALDEAVDDP